jgi:hypothetical protein
MLLFSTSEERQNGDCAFKIPPAGGHDGRFWGCRAQIVAARVVPLVNLGGHCGQGRLRRVSDASDALAQNGRLLETNLETAGQILDKAGLQVWPEWACPHQSYGHGKSLTPILDVPTPREPYRYLDAGSMVGIWHYGETLGWCSYLVGRLCPVPCFHCAASLLVAPPSSVVFPSHP